MKWNIKVNLTAFKLAIHLAIQLSEAEGGTARHELIYDHLDIKQSVFRKFDTYKEPTSVKKHHNQPYNTQHGGYRHPRELGEGGGGGLME